ncbi:MAG: hypothetical protein SFT93_05750 [Rickettsiaceae bacterium]|nr:hypothetical protein [Rickettsiaceae bacterium]
MANNLNSIKRKIEFFYNGLTNYFRDDIDSSVLSPLANMLVFHYLHEDDYELSHGLKKAIDRIKVAKGSTIITSYDFSVVLYLFAVAISKNDFLQEDLEENIQLDKNKKYVLNQILINLGADTSEGLKEYLKYAIDNNDIYEIINFATTNPSKLKDLFRVAETTDKLQSKEEGYKLLADALKKFYLGRGVLTELGNVVNLASPLIASIISSYACLTGLGLLGTISLIPAILISIKLIMIPAEKFVHNSLGLYDILNPPEKIFAKKLKDNDRYYQTQMSMSARAMREQKNTDIFSDKLKKDAGKLMAESIKHVVVKEGIKPLGNLKSKGLSQNK